MPSLHARLHKLSLGGQYQWGFIQLSSYHQYLIFKSV